VTRFATCFLLIFGELSFGGFLAMAVPPFFKVERGFYKSSALVYEIAAALTALGFGLLAIRGNHLGGPSAAQLWTSAAIWIGFCVDGGIYMTSLWGENGTLRARSYTTTLAVGLAAVCYSAWILKPIGFGVAGSIAYGLSAFFSSIVLGMSSASMLFGHWYLIDPNLPVDYLKTLVRLFRFALVGELIAIAIVIILFLAAGSHGMKAAAQTLLDTNYTLLGVRLLLGPVVTLVLAWMTWQTLKIPQTMAATGLLYIAVMSVLVGELLGRFILFRTAMPL